MLEETIRRKVQDLIRRAPSLVSDSRRSSTTYGLCEGWVTEAVNVIEVAIPIETNAYRRRIRAIEERQGAVGDKVAAIAAILEALLPDIDARLLTDFGNEVRAETFDDFLDHADIYLREGEKQAAGVLAGVVFEDTIRRICRGQNIPDKDESLEQLINALARKGVITSLQSKGAKVAAHVRTKATHALWDEYDLDGVAATIQLTQTFLREHLRG